MAMAERGSFLWALVSITQIWLAIKLIGDVESWLTTLLGASGAACVMLALVIFKQEQRDMLLNPMKNLQKEVHQEQITKQGRGVWIGIVLWLAAMMFGTIAL
ncbi:MAG: hypothetical protein VX230_00570 [Candidatus Thermoplasmatota archaeon]|nr:hypothetical protein [Candidatus Thermoplasmatota archaeon]